MSKFRKKPVVIEAVRLGWDSWNEICDFVGVDGEHAVGGMKDTLGKYYWGEPARPGPEDNLALKIRTLEGDMIADAGDWVIKGVKGEFYPCKPDIFEVTYESVDERPTLPEPVHGLLGWGVPDPTGGGFLSDGHPSARGALEGAVGRLVREGRNDINFTRST